MPFLYEVIDFIKGIRQMQIVEKRVRTEVSLYDHCNEPYTKDKKLTKPKKLYNSIYLPKHICIPAPTKKC